MYKKLQVPKLLLFPLLFVCFCSLSYLFVYLFCFAFIYLFFSVDRSCSFQLIIFLQICMRYLFLLISFHCVITYLYAGNVTTKLLFSMHFIVVRKIPSPLMNLEEKFLFNNFLN